MNKVIAGLFVAALGTTLVMADVGAPSYASKDLKKIVEEGPYVETSQKGIKLSGYVDAGYLYNFNGRDTNMNSTPKQGNVTANQYDGDGGRRGDFNLNAAKLVLEKPLSDANELQAGFRMDLMMGEDADIWGQDVVGSDSSFLEQAYVQFRLPYGNGIDFKVGKFVSILGYEVLERPSNLNITYGNIFTNLVPKWHTGALMSYQVNDMFDLKLGITNGQNVDNGIGQDARDNGAVLAALNFTVPGGNANWYNAVMYSINGEGAGAWDDSPYVVYDTYINWTPKFANDKLLLGVNFDLGQAEVASGIGAAQPNTTTFTGVGLYAKYQFTDIFSLATRGDWIHNDDSNFFGNAVAPSREDIWSWTLTAGFDVIENMMLRTEYRLDWGKDYANGLGASNCTDGPMHSTAVQVVYSF